MAKRLQLTFKNAAGKAFSLSIANPKKGINGTDITNACKQITDKGVLVNRDGEVAEVLAAAKMIETNVTQLV